VIRGSFSICAIIELTKRLLALARRQPLLPERVDLNMLIEEISMLLHHQSCRQGHRPRLEQPVAFMI
jgi:hypothetical protein